MTEARSYSLGGFVQPGGHSNAAGNGMRDKKCGCKYRQVASKPLDGVGTHPRRHLWSGDDRSRRLGAVHRSTRRPS